MILLQLKTRNAIKNQNFWIAVSLIIGGFWVGFNNEEATNLVMNIFAVVAGVGFFANYFKDAKTEVKKWVQNANFWTYLSVIVTNLIPDFPAEALTAVQEIVINIFGQNWQGVLSGVFTLITFIYKVVTTREEEGTDGEAVNLTIGQ